MDRNVVVLVRGPDLRWDLSYPAGEAEGTSPHTVPPVRS